MKKPSFRDAAVCAWMVVFLAGLSPLQAGDFDTMGVTLLRQVDPTLTGAGVRVAQPEANTAGSGLPQFEVRPSAVGQPTNLFTYASSNGTATVFPNSVGIESGHADLVGTNFYGSEGGVAPGVSHVDNYDADYFVDSVIFATSPLPIPARVVNQSFVFDYSDETVVDLAYDDYAAYFNTIFVSAAGNGGPVYPAATCYNGLGAGVVGQYSSHGPTADGRCKPDIIAPESRPNEGATSYSTPYVAGAVAVLAQAAGRGDGGANVAAAADLRTIKALLLNGAVKPTDWTNGVTTPLDARYGAGIVNLFNSWKQLGGGQQAFIESTSNTTGSPHPPGTGTGSESTLVGWDFNSLTNASDWEDQVNHYYFNAASYPGASFTLTTTLIWNRRYGETFINDLNLFLYDTSNSNLVACSTSAVDNVEHLFLPTLPQGRYDLQVQKNASARVSPDETYALAFEFFTLDLNIALSDTNAVISWPISPAGFTLQGKTNLASVLWTPVNAAVSVSNNQNLVLTPVTGASQFFRLRRP